MFRSNKQMTKDQITVCPLCGSKTKQCLMMQIKEAVDLPVAELQTSLKKTIAFFQEDSSQTLKALWNQQCVLDQQVCIACVHLLNSSMHCCTRKMQNGVFQVYSSPPIKESVEEEQPLVSKFESRKVNKPIEIVYPHEKEPEGTLIFLNPFSSLSSKLKSMPKYMPRSTFHSEDLKRIFSNSPPASSTVTPEDPDKKKNVTNTNVKAIITPIPKPSEPSPKPTESSSQGSPKPTVTSLQASPKPAESSSHASPKPTETSLQASPKPAESSSQASPKRTESSSQASPKPAESSSQASPNPTDTNPQASVLSQTHPVEGDKENPWGEKIAANQPMLNKFSSSGDEKQQAFMNLLDLCKQTKPSSSGDSEPSTSNYQLGKSKATVGSLSPLSRSSPRSSPRLTANPQTNHKPSPRNSPLSSSSPSSLSPTSVNNPCKNLNSVFDAVAKSNQVSTPDSTMDASTLLERVLRVTKQKPCPVAKPPTKFFSFTCKTTPDPEEEDEESLFSLMSSLNSGRAKYCQDRKQPIVPNVILPEEEEETDKSSKIDLFLKPIKISRDLTKPLPFKPSLPDLSNIKAANAAAFQAAQQQDKQYNETESSLKSILKKPKQFVLGAKKTTVKNVTFTGSSIHYIHKTEEEFGIESEETESNSQQNFTATSSVQSVSSSLQVNLTSDSHSSDISLNVESKTPSDDGEVSPKKAIVSPPVGESPSKSQEKCNNVQSPHNKKSGKKNNADVFDDDKLFTPDKNSRRLSEVKGTPELSKCRIKKKIQLDNEEILPKKLKLTKHEFVSATEYKKTKIEVTPSQSLKKEKRKSGNGDSCSTTPTGLRKSNSGRLLDAIGTPELNKSGDKRKQKHVPGEAETTNNIDNNALNKTAASEQFLKAIGLIDNDDEVTLLETLSVAPEVLNDNPSQVSCNALINCDPVPTTSGLSVEDPKQKQKGRPASKKIKPSDNSDICGNATQTKSKKQTKNKKRKMWKAKYIADRVVANDSEVSNEELLNAQRRMMSCFVYLTRCDENAN